ncbi:MAG TPA: hypothetical protein VIW94_03865 [Acidimicrobiia bacterium]
MQSVRLVGENWAGAPAQIATSPIDYWRGIKGVAGGSALILRRRAVHTMGLTTPLRGVGLDASGTVMMVKTMWPNRFFYFPSAVYLVEFPVELQPPRPGTRIAMIRDD